MSNHIIGNVQRATDRRLKVVHVATNAVPFVRDDQKRGLPEVVGVTVGAQVRLGIDARLILPLFQETKAVIAEKELKLEDRFAFEMQLGAPPMKEVRVRTIASPFTPHYPVYFVEERSFSEQNPKYGQPNELERLAIFSLAARKLQRILSPAPEEAPDIFECHDWQTALLALYLGRNRIEQDVLQPGADLYFAHTKSVFAVYGFVGGGDYLPNAAYHAAMGWEIMSALPSYAEFHGRLNLLKAGLYRSDLSYARSLESIEREINEKSERGFDGIARERMGTGALVGLFPDDSIWRPGQEYTEEIALAGARRRLSLYRSIIDFPFAGMEQSVQIVHPLPYRVYTPAEQLEAINTFVRGLYEKLDEKERKPIDDAILAGQGIRFKGINDRVVFDNILNFLKIERQNTFGFEERMRAEGLGKFLSLFYVGDINRMLSEIITPEMVGDIKSGMSLYDFIGGFQKNEGGTLIDHLIRHFKTLELISKAVGMKDDELKPLLEQYGEYIGEESLANSTAEFRHLSEVFSSINQPEVIKYFRAFVIGVLLHDIGQAIDFDTHPTEGARLFDSLIASRGFLSEEERRFVRYLIYNHSVFGDIFVTRQQRSEDVHRLKDFSGGDKATRELAIKCCYLISIMDMNSIGERGKLTDYDLERVREAYNCIIFSKTKHKLDDGLKRLGHGEDSGKYRWDDFVTGKFGAKISTKEKEDLEKADRKAADIELRVYCANNVRTKNAELIAEIKSAESEKTKRLLQLQLEGKIKEEMDKYYAQCKIGSFYTPMDLKFHPFDAKLRARLLIWKIEYSKKSVNSNFSLRISARKEIKQNELARLTALLEEFDIDKITDAFEFQPRPSQLQYSIRLRSQ